MVANPASCAKKKEPAGKPAPFALRLASVVCSGFLPEDSPMSRPLTFLLLCAAALALSFIPVVHVPLDWFETLLHESSHALAARLTGGRVDRVLLYFNGSGLTWSAGGWPRLVAFSGYAGAVVWGALLYWLASNMDARRARVFVIGVLVLLGLETVFWLAFSPSSLLIMGVMMLMMGALLHPLSQTVAHHALQFIGLYTLLSALRSPLVLFGFAGDNDAATLRSLTFIPATVWVLIWCGMGVGALWVLFRDTLRPDQAPKTP